VRCLGRATERDGDGEVLRDPWLEKKNRGSTRPMAGESQRRDGENQRQGEAAETHFLLLSSFFFLFYFFLLENQVLLGVDFFMHFFLFS
jgi:hypothetical protein